MVDSICHAPATFSVTLLSDILSAETSGFPQQIIFLKSCISVLRMYVKIGNTCVEIRINSDFNLMSLGVVVYE